MEPFGYSESYLSIILTSQRSRDHIGLTWPLIQMVPARTFYSDECYVSKPSRYNKSFHSISFHCILYIYVVGGLRSPHVWHTAPRVGRCRDRSCAGS